MSSSVFGLNTVSQFPVILLLYSGLVTSKRLVLLASASKGTTLLKVSFLKNPSKNIFHADRFDVDSNGNRYVYKFNPSLFKFKYYSMTYNHPSMFIKNYEYNLHLYNKKLKAASDYQFILEALLRDKKIFQKTEI